MNCVANLSDGIRIVLTPQKLPELQQEVLELEQKFKALTCLEDLKEKRQDIIHQSAWAQVAELEKVRGY